MLNAALWQQHSAEYVAAAHQSYALATTRLDEALADVTWTAALEQRGDPRGLPPALIMDLDETVIDNAVYEARIVRELGEYSPASFARWCEEGRSGVVPGAAEFIAEARRRKVKVFYYTARRAALRGCTLSSLERLGLAPAADEALFLRDAGSKSQVRERLAADHRIVLLIGDNLEDFVDGSKASAESRRALARRHASWFGKRWIVLPNATYGHWEATYYDFDYAAPRADKLRRKRAALRP